jgi:predicted TIM-barrel fold metal-dependent hydrolase
MIIEWNAHMFASDTDAYPFHPDATYVPDPARRSADPLADYRERMDELGIDRAVLVQPEPYGDDHRLVLDCATADPERFRATTLFYPQDPDAPETLRELVGEYGDLIVATRFHAHRDEESYLDSFEDPGVRRLWAAAADLGLVVELHIGPNYAADAERLIAEHPDTPVLIDHLAEPHTGDAVEFADVLALAEYDNVYVKLSGLGHFADDAPRYESARPFTRWVVDAFGPERMAWGGDTPEVVDVHLADRTAAERERVKGGTVAELAWEE